MTTDSMQCYGSSELMPNSDGPTNDSIGALPGCWAIYGEVLAKEYSDLQYFQMHQYTLDTYAIQHQGTPSRKSIQLVAVHLVSLYFFLNRDTNLKRLLE